MLIKVQGQGLLSGLRYLSMLLNTQFVQCAFLVPQLSKSRFCHTHVKQPYRRLWRLVVSYKGEKAFITIYLVCTAAVHRAHC